MKCLACGAGLEYVQNVTFARCSHCLQLYTVKNNGPHQRWVEPLEVRAPNGQIDPEFTAMYAQQLGFAPRKASHAVMGVGGVNVVVPTGRIERDIRNKISGWIWGLVIGAFILLLMAGIFGWVIWTAMKASKETGEASNPASAKAVTWDGKSGYTCGGIDNVTIEKVTAKLATGTAITAMGNCQLTLVNVDITAPVVVEASANAVVTFKGGSVNGSTNSAVATANGKVDFQGTTVKGPTKAAGNAKVTGAK
jgi:hypothetical protein